MRWVGYTAPFAAGAASFAAGRDREPISSAKAMPASCFAGLSQRFEKMSRVRAAGEACQACGDGCGAGGACGCRAWRVDGARRWGFIDGVAKPPARRRPEPSYTLQTYARRRSTPPRPVERKDALLLLPRAPHKGHAAVEAVAAQVVAVHTY